MSLIQVDWKPNDRFLRGFGLLGLVMFGLLGLLVYLTHKILFWHLGDAASANTAYALWGIAALCGILAPIAPRALLPLYVGMTAVALPIGFVMSHVIMGIIFFLVITPIGLFFRLVGRDALQRRFEREAESYWSRRKAVKDVRRYYRQF